MWIRNPYYLAGTSVANDKSYLLTTLARLNENDHRLGTCLMAAAVTGLGIFFNTKSVIVKVGSIFAAFGGFWWAWIGYNYFFAPRNALGQDVSHHALFGPQSKLASLGDLYNGIGFVALACALIVGFVINRKGKGIFAFITALGAITGVLIFINLWKTFKGS